MLQLGSVSLQSHLLLGTGRYPSLDIMRQAHAAAQVNMVTISLRRAPVKGSVQESLFGAIDPDMHILPNTAGIASAGEALRMARLAASMGYTHLKLEVMGDQHTLLPDTTETIRALEVIKADSATGHLYVMVYTSDDPVAALRLLRTGADAIMPAGSPIGSGRGLANPDSLRMLLDLVRGRVPVLLDAGIGAPSDAALAMEMGFDGVLLNSAVALAEDPVVMARAMALATEAGRLSAAAGRIPRKLYGTASGS